MKSWVAFNFFMQILKPNKFGIQQAVRVLKRGGVVIYPTDTAYALGGIFDSKKVTAKILKIKNRSDKKFTIIASSLAQVEKNFKLNHWQKKLAKKYWPGPLSLVVSSRFAVRVPKNKVALTLVREVGKPLIATSANVSGQKTLYDSKEIVNQFSGKKNTPDIILSSGKFKKIKTSTVVKVSNNKIEVLRAGAVKINRLI